ncbi:inactive ubiquitin carboxyl-terminal hydrolase MINDY-4B-like [Penaeus chinensis]|uniref:inactive ubiquitin carboxyl-terminal hydrolase MINDY-4B-like n=1 Tax=Penaeus chinensis TaxID=139456 RepID=UPI001FB7BB05|nr:inactive ubiquitin carboxyl-terminal hydrolase MINDY-4B-like [Penaeus chinensis]
MTGVFSRFLPLSLATPERVLYPTKPKTSVQKVPVLGGSPISFEEATTLRARVFGSASLLGAAENEWLGQSFCFHEPEKPLGYALKVTKNTTKGLAMCVQGYILKHLLFSRRGPRVVADPASLLKASAKSQEDCLVGALSDILWKVGDRQRAVLCLTQDEVHVNDSQLYRGDGCTERIHTFEFRKQDELTFNLKKYLFEFMSEGGDGLLLFVYSIVLSRGFEKLKEDMADEEVSLVQTNGAIHPVLAALMLTGRASHYLHNGVIYEGSESSMGKPKTGLITRGEVGYLVWRREEEGGEVPVGSRLKTPSLPVWVTRCNDHYGILFNPNRELTRDYHAENRFDLHYYSSHASQVDATIVTIDTRSQTVKDEFHAPPLENLVHTKWQGADVNWNGTAPYV